LADLDGDGRQEIIAVGINNGYRQATLVALDADRVFGASAETARPELQLHGMGTAQERVRLLFPRSDINRTLSVYNIPQEIVVNQGRIRVKVLECVQPPGCAVLYEFDTKFNLIAAGVDDQFRAAHRELYRTGAAQHPFTPQEEVDFQKVRCLSGCPAEFVSVQNRGRKALLPATESTP
jgi:hypothetical protein